MEKEMSSVESLMQIANEFELTELCYSGEDFKLHIKTSPQKTEKKETKKITKPKLDTINSTGVGRYKFIKNGSPVIKIGDEIKVGTKLGVIEAVGIESALISPMSGTIESFCVENNDPVDFGKPLLKIKKA